MKIKNKFKKTSIVLLALLMTFTTIKFNGIKDINAATLYPEATIGISGSSISVDLSSAGINKTGIMYNMKMDGSTAFCMDTGLRASSGTVYAKTSTKTGSVYNRIWNYFLKDDTINGYLQSSSGTWSTNNRAGAQAMIWAYEEGLSNANAGKALRKVIETVWPGIAAAPDFTLEEWANDAKTYNDSSGTLSIYNSGKSGYQRIITSTSGVQPQIRNSDVSSTKSYKTTESIKVQINKSDVDTNGKLSGVPFDFYKDNVKGGSSITDSTGKAEHTFNTEFSKEASVTKEYCVNYDDLSIPNQEKVTGYTSKAAAQTAADKEALEKAKELAEAGSGQEHTYKVVETATKTNYWLNPANNTFQKKLTGSGTVIFDVTNKRQQGSITITKRDSETNNLVDNAIYGLYARTPIIHPDGTTGTVFNKEQLVATFPGTAANGTSKLSGLYLGQYYVKEITAPSGYLHSSEVYNVDLNYAGQNVEITDASTTVKDKVQRAKVTSIKQDKELDNGSKDENIFDFNKDGAQGDATRVRATYGLYARENITHADGSTGVVTYNQVDNSIHEIKAVKGTELSVENVKATAGTLLATIKTDSNAEFGFEHLYNGKYFIKEITPSEGYTLDPTEYDVDLTYTNQNEQVVIKSNKVLEQVKKQAFDLFKAGHVPGTSTNAKPLEGVEFTVWLESDLQFFVNQGKTLVEAKTLAPVYDKLVTKVDGTASSIELPFGKYRVSETKAAPDYATADDFFVNVTEDSRTHQSFTNNVIIDEKFTGLIQAIKLDKETGKQVKLEGAEFKIKNTDKDEYVGYWEWLPFPHYVSSWTTNSEGYVRLQEKLEAGNYTLEEIHAPYGYVLDTEPVTFKITNEQMYEVAEDGKTPLIKTYKSDVSVKGKIIIEKQGDVLTDYKDSQFVYELKGLKDAEYDIYAENPILDPSNDKTVLYAKDQLVTSIKTGVDGKVSSKELPLGEYYSKERKAPSGYILSDEIKHFKLEYENETVPIVYDSTIYVNERQKVSIEASKQDTDTKEFLANAEISLYANRDVYNYLGEIIVEGQTLLETVTTGADGKAAFKTDLPNDITPEYAVMPIGDEFDDVDPGFTNNVVDGVKLVGDSNSLFVVKETKEPDGYLKYAVNYYIDTKYTTQDESVLKFETAFFNDQTVTHFDKQDASTNKSINQGGEYQIIDPITNKIVSNWTGNGEIHTEKGLFFEKEYIWHEVQAPNGYDKTDDIRFTVSKDSIVIMKDKPLLIIEKLDKVDNFIVAGNELELRDAETNEVVQNIVTTDQSIILNNLVTGKEYIIKEVKQAEGYFLNKEEVKFKFEPGMTVKFYNNPILTDIMADKRDSQTMKPVISKKFAFTIYSDASCKIPVSTVYADEKTGTATFKNVRYGVWYIKETAAPEGYKLSDEVKKVVVDDSLDGVGDMYSFVYLNTLLPTTTIITTGDITALSSLIILALGSLVAISLSKKRKKAIIEDEE